MRSLLLAFGLLTRVPVPSVSVDEARLAHAVGWFPLVGLFLGGVLAGAAWLFAGRLPDPLLAVALVALLALLTGGLHLDGLADCFDGLGAPPPRMREAMRDPRLGALGATALVLVLLAKVTALGALLGRFDVRPLLLFPLVSRWSASLLVVTFRPAEGQGLGRSFGERAGLPQLLLASGIAGAALVAWGAGWVVPAAAGVGAALLFGGWLRRRLGGLTGDVHGGAIELAELAFLVAAVCR